MKLTVFGAGITFIVALLLGFLSGNTVLVVLLRSGISALIFAGGSLLLSFVIQRFLPELAFAPRAARAEGDLDGDDGSVDSGSRRTKPRINILVQDEEENDETVSSSRNTSESENLFSADANLSQVVEEVVEERVSTVSLGNSLDHEGDSGEFFGDDSSAGPDDDLPDIAGFESSFSSSTKDQESTADNFEENESSSSSRGSSKKPRSGGLPENSMDPQILAKAISTALKKAT